tara:strand:- start:355 stop:981 length:627 start_codon:yes stop_codon:yes gene_type:complete
MMLFMSMAPSAFSPAAGMVRVQSARPTMQPAPRMVVGEFSTVSMSTIYAVEQNLPAVLLAKSGADELLDEFASVFPIVFVGALLVGFGYQYVKNTIAREELSITLPELPEDAGTLKNYEPSPFTIYLHRSPLTFHPSPSPSPLTTQPSPSPFTVTAHRSPLTFHPHPTPNQARSSSTRCGSPPSPASVWSSPTMPACPSPRPRNSCRR